MRTYEEQTALILEKATQRISVRKRSVRNRIITPIGSITAVFVIFVGLVNVSPAIALAMEKIPGLRQLAEFVSFSSSLTEAVEHEFVQFMGLEQTIGDVTMRVEHVIVDGQQLHIFYTMKSSVYANMGTSITGYGVCEGGRNVEAKTILGIVNPLLNEKESGDMNHIVIGFEKLVPPVVVWHGQVLYLDDPVGESMYNPIGQYSFIIEIDEIFAVQEIFEVNHEITLDGQRMTITTVELNPAHTRVNIEEEWANNTKHLQRLVFHMINDRGERFDPPTSETGGLINLPAGGAGNDGPWRLGDHFLETAFFSESESLTLVITGVEWIGMKWMGPDSIQLDTLIEIRVK